MPKIAPNRLIVTFTKHVYFLNESLGMSAIIVSISLYLFFYSILVQLESFLGLSLVKPTEIKVFVRNQRKLVSAINPFFEVKLDLVWTTEKKTRRLSHWIANFWRFVRLCVFCYTYQNPKNMSLSTDMYYGFLVPNALSVQKRLAIFNLFMNIFRKLLQVWKKFLIDFC